MAAWREDLAAAAGASTPPYRTVVGPEAVEPHDLPVFPLFVKPRYEGTSKRITAQSRVETLDALRARVRRVTAAYRQEALEHRGAPPATGTTR